MSAKVQDAIRQIIYSITHGVTAGDVFMARAFESLKQERTRAEAKVRQWADTVESGFDRKGLQSVVDEGWKLIACDDLVDRTFPVSVDAVSVDPAMEAIKRRLYIPQPSQSSVNGLIKEALAYAELKPFVLDAILLPVGVSLATWSRYEGFIARSGAKPVKPQHAILSLPPLMNFMRRNRGSLLFPFRDQRIAKYHEIGGRPTLTFEDAFPLENEWKRGLTQRHLRIHVAAIIS